MKILVVDDSRTNLAAAKKHLEEMGEITGITLCNDPTAAQGILDDNSIDILLLDVVMPKVSGFDILKGLRSDRRYDQLPIIMFTSLSDDESFKTCFELGATDYVSKPIHPVEFKTRIKAAIDVRKKTARLSELLEELSSQNLRLKEANTKLYEAKNHLVQQEKMAAIGQLSAGIAHEINNPMGFVSSNFETLSKYMAKITEYMAAADKAMNDLRSSPDDASREAAGTLTELYRKLKLHIIIREIGGLLEDSHDGIRRVSKIVQSLRNFTRTTVDGDKELCGLMDLVNQVVLISHNEVKYNADVFVNIPDSTAVYCNQVQLGQVLINILVNAAQAIKSQHRKNMGRIQLRAFEEDGGVRIEIEDDGPGIPPENLGRIFDPFFTTKDVGEGTGLGLSISYDIITSKHGGSIDVFSTVGLGTTFCIKLPPQPAAVLEREVEDHV